MTNSDFSPFVEDRVRAILQEAVRHPNRIHQSGGPIDQLNEIADVLNQPRLGALRAILEALSSAHVERSTQQLEALSEPPVPESDPVVPSLVSELLTLLSRVLYGGEPLEDALASLDKTALSQEDKELIRAVLKALAPLAPCRASPGGPDVVPTGRGRGFQR